MSWRGSTSPQERAFACLPYLLPLIASLEFASPFLNQFPFLGILLVPIMPILSLYGAFPLAGLIVFFALYMGVVRNEKIAHFIRFNAMQAILLDIILMLCGLLFRVLAPGLGNGLIVETLYNVVFLGAIAAIIYSIVQSILGRYAEIPTLSEAVYMQVR